MNAEYDGLRYRLKVNHCGSAWTVRFLFPGCEHPVEWPLVKPGGSRTTLMPQASADKVARAVLADVRRKRLRCATCNDDSWRWDSGRDMHYSFFTRRDGRLDLRWNGSWPRSVTQWPEAFADWRA